ncbi:MAG: hypothetical protein IJK52_06805 [Oscillospiraceae bacterium]|nr:hypothetical protein [Oscillospiraceae bacterium]
MEIENTLSASVSAARNRAAYDAACKRLLSEKIVLAWILKRCVKEFENYEASEIAERFIEGQPQVSSVPLAGSVIQGLSQESASSDEGRAFFDIYFSAVVPGADEIVQLIINVEAQNKFYPGYPLLKRGVFYAGRMISAQDGTVFAKSHYEKLRKVYSIWICVNPPKKRENTITRYHIAEENLLGAVREDERNYDLLSVVMVCLGRADADGGDALLKLLGTLLSRDTRPEEKKRILRDEFDIPMTRTLEKEAALMCNLSEGVWEEGVEVGMERGLKKGRAEGVEQTLLTALQNLMKSMGLSVEQAMDALIIPESDRPKYAAKLQKE